MTIENSGIFNLGLLNPPQFQVYPLKFWIPIPVKYLDLGLLGNPFFGGWGGVQCTTTGRGKSSGKATKKEREKGALLGGPFKPDCSKKIIKQQIL